MPTPTAFVIRRDGRIKLPSMLARSGRGDTVYGNPSALRAGGLARKPGAFAQRRLQGSRCFRLRSNVYDASSPVDDGNRQMVDILNAVLTDGLPAVEAACAEAIAHGVHSADVVAQHPDRQRDLRRRPTLTPAALTLRHCPRSPTCAPLRQPQENHLMERTQLFDLMGELKLYGMKAAFRRDHDRCQTPARTSNALLAILLNAEINEKQARSIKYQLTIAKLPLAKDLEDFQFEHTDQPDAR